MNELELYLIKNQEGKWFRAKGYGGSGDNWTDNIKIARIYGNLRAARGVVGFYAKNYSDYGIPQIMKINIAGVESLAGEEERVQKSIEKRKREDERRDIRTKERALRQAKSDFEEAQFRYHQLTRV